MELEGNAIFLSRPKQTAYHSFLDFFFFRKAKEFETLKKKLQEIDPNLESSVAPLKKSLAELEKERMEADKKWEQIQKQEKVLKRLKDKTHIISLAMTFLLYMLRHKVMMNVLNITAEAFPCKGTLS